MSPAHYVVAWSIVLLTAHAQAAPSLQVRGAAAWQGLVKLNAPAELRLGMSGLGGTVAVSVAQPAAAPHLSYRTSVQVVAGIEGDHVVAVGEVHGSPLHVVAVRDDGVAVELDVDLRVVPSAAKVVAFVGSWEGAAAPGDWQSIFPGIASLPFRGSSYASIDALVIDEGALLGIESEQMQALQAYAAACGRILVKGVSRLVEALQSGAGCSGRFVASTAGDGSLADEIKQALSEVPESMPTSAALAELSGRRSDFVAVTSWLGTGYFVLSLLAANMRMRFAHILLLPLLVCSAVALVLPTIAPGISLVSWVEADAGDAVARQVGLLSIEGSHRGVVDVEVPVQFGVPTPIHPAQAATDVNQRDDAFSLRLPMRLLEQRNFALATVLSVSDLPALSFVDSKPLVRPIAGAASVPTLLAWDGRKFVVPSLGPGESWQPEGEPAAWGSGAIERAFRKRALRDKAALLVEPASADPRRLDLAMVRIR